MIGTSNDASHNKISTGEDISKAELTTDNGNGKLPPVAPSLRARLIGQGYKQVRAHQNFFQIILNHDVEMEFMKLQLSFLNWQAGILFLNSCASSSLQPF